VTTGVGAYQGRGWPVELETKRLKLRSLKPGDESERWLGWIKDPEVMHPANAPARQAKLQEMVLYINSFNNYTRYLIGVFHKASGLHIGSALVEVDRRDEIATLHIGIGEKSFWGKGIVNEARAALLDYLFDTLGIAKVCGAPFSRNFRMIFNYKAQGWIHEGTLRSQVRSVVDGSRLDQLRFRLLPHEWRAVRDKVRDK
jgi:RimJ/RimL family protein N-acetyltransferase